MQTRTSKSTGYIRRIRAAAITRQLDRYLKEAGIHHLEPDKKKNTFIRNMLAAMIRYERWKRDPRNAEVVAWNTMRQLI